MYIRLMSNVRTSYVVFRIGRCICFVAKCYVSFFRSDLFSLRFAVWDSKLSIISHAPLAIGYKKLSMFPPARNAPYVTCINHLDAPCFNHFLAHYPLERELPSGNSGTLEALEHDILGRSVAGLKWLRARAYQLHLHVHTKPKFVN